MPDLRLRFTPDPKYVSRTKKEAEHQASLLVLQYLQKRELCGKAEEMDPLDRDGKGACSYAAAIFIMLGLLRVTTELHASEDEAEEAWIDVHGDGGILKKIIKEGEGYVVAPNQYVSGRAPPPQSSIRRA